MTWFLKGLAVFAVIISIPIGFAVWFMYQVVKHDEFIEQALGEDR